MSSNSSTQEGTVSAVSLRSGFPLSWWEADIVGRELGNWAPLASLIADSTGQDGSVIEIKLALGWDWKKSPW